MAKYELEGKLENYYKNIYNDLEQKTLDDEFGSYVLNRLKTGNKKAYNKSLIETRNFNMEFLNVIESCYPALLKLLRNPVKSIKYNEEIVNVEKAKKVTADTVRHLSSHTHLIKDIKPEGVVPAKVLSTFSEEDLGVYENRFLKSLIKRIEVFLERRYEVMKVSLDSFEADHLNYENEFLMSGKNVNVKLDIDIKEIFTKDIESTKADYERLLRVRELIRSLKGTELMQKLSKAKDIFPPIMRTNMILHNPDFKMCYNLWVYLDKTDGLSSDIDVKEKTYKYTDIVEKDINQALVLAVSAFIRSREIEGIVPSKQKAVLKAPKVVENKEISDVPSMEPKVEKMEDYKINEFLLSQTAKYYEVNYDGLQRSGSNESESLRVIYKQMLEMLDQIYPKVFNISDDDYNKKDLYEKLEYTRKKQNVLKIVQKQKQMNIARMGKSIKKCESDIAALERRIKLKEAREKALEKRKKERQERALMTKEEREALRLKEQQRIAKLLKEKKQNEAK